jgi:hypothetical protein
LDAYKRVSDDVDCITADATLKASHEKIAKILKSCCLGYGSFNFLTNETYGTGPVLERRRYNRRPINQGGVKSLLRMHKTGTLQRDSSDPAKLIILVVSPSLIEPNTLLQTPTQGLFPGIDWVNNAKNLVKNNSDLVAAIANGNHRCTATESLGKDLLQKLEEITKEVGKFKTFQIGTEYSKVKNETCSKILNDLEVIGSWNCIVYDLGRSFFFPFWHSQFD